jgi:hypothetical protein
MDRAETTLRSVDLDNEDIERERVGAWYFELSDRPSNRPIAEGQPPSTIGNGDPSVPVEAEVLVEPRGRIDRCIDVRRAFRQSTD